MRSPDEHPGNWIETTADASQITIRQFFGDWAEEERTSVRVERVGQDGPPPPISPKHVAKRLTAASGWVANTMQYRRNWQERYREQPNTFRSSATHTTVGAARARRLGAGRRLLRRPGRPQLALDGRPQRGAHRPSLDTVR